jgi:CubicO group peptidase (beta-lactamase class C family)
MSGRGFTPEGLDRLTRVMEGHTGAGEVPGLAWLVARGGETHAGVAGSAEPGGGRAVERDTIFRIASMTKPVTAAAAMILVEECRLRLDDPVDELLPELADRQVLRNPEGSLTDTVPAHRPITLRDLLTFRLGLGMDFTNFDRPQPVLERIVELGVGSGPPRPQEPPAPDEWMRRLGTVPLAYQPGERWLYHIGSEVTGVLVARAAGQPFADFLRERIFDPLGMSDTGFFVPPDRLDRFGPCWTTNYETGTIVEYDPAAGQWSTAPPFPSGGGGLVSTVDDYAAFAELLLGEGRARGQRMLSPASVAAMVTAHVGTAPDPDAGLGWGFGVSVQLHRTGVARSPGSYGWDGGLGSSWVNDPVEGLTGVLLTNRTFSSPVPPPVVQDFWTCTYTALDR